MVQEDVVGHDEVGPLADQEGAGVDAPGGEHFQFFQEYIGVHHHAVAYYPVDVGPADARRDQVKQELAHVVDHGVARVVAAGVTDNTVDAGGKVVDDLSFTLVAPLATDYGVSRHYRP